MVSIVEVITQFIYNNSILYTWYDKHDSCK